MTGVAGRDEEKIVLAKIEKSGEPELVAVYGRRRVGKTYLIRNLFTERMAFELSGLNNAILEQQLENFAAALTIATCSQPLTPPAT